MATDTRVQPAPAVAAAAAQPLRGRSGLMAVFRHVILLPGVVFFVIPLVFMVSTSLKALRQIALFPPELIPNPVLWANYPEVFHYAPMHLYFVNTLFLVLPAIFGAVFTSSLAAYAFARLRAPGKNAIFIVLLSTMMVPAFVTMIPTYILFAKLRWVGGFKPLVIPYLMGSAFFVFLLRQFFLTIPRELEDAAFIDGSSRLRTFTGIVLPLAKPVLATVTIFAFMASWNEYMGPLIYLSNKKQYVLSLGLQVFTDAYGGEWGLLMAASSMMVAPVILLFFFAQKHFVTGITMSGLKG